MHSNLQPATVEKTNSGHGDYMDDDDDASMQLSSPVTE